MIVPMRDPKIHTRPSCWAAGVIAFASVDGTAVAQTTPIPPAQPSIVMPPITVTAPAAAGLGVADTATEGDAGQEQVEQQPRYRVGEVLEAVPGLIITQHSGEGKANQYFMRGFNLATAPISSSRSTTCRSTCARTHTGRATPISAL